MKILNILDRNSPAILSAAGIAGFVTSVVMAAKATPKAEIALEDQAYEHRYEYPDWEPTLKERIIAIAPAYAPTVGMMMVSTACILGANRIHRYRYASLLALYSVSEKTLQRWQDSVSEEVTKKKLGQIKERVLKPEEDLPEINIEDERTLFFDRYSGRYFRSSSIETVRKIVNDMNDRMYAEDYVSINDFYWGVGLPNVEFGGEIGWNISDGPIKIEFDSYLKDDRPVVTVNFKGLNPRSYR